MSNPLETLSEKVRDKYDADLVVYFGPIHRPKDDFLMDECVSRKKRKNVILHISTYGGDAHPAYRIARALQRRYCRDGGKFYAFVNSVCASAGTLLVMGADELILSDHAELGPIDVQLRKTDEVGERTSGLTPVQALESLASESLNLFKAHFGAMRFDPDLIFPTSLASKIAAELASGLIGRLYEQIDPMRVAEINRFLQITEEYGRRIGKNLKPGALDTLLSKYPAHDFVIDPQEAQDLFVRVSDPDPTLEEFGAFLKPHSDKYLHSPTAQVTYISETAKPTPPPATPKKHENAPQQPRARARNNPGNGSAENDGKAASSGKAAVRKLFPKGGLH